MQSLFSPAAGLIDIPWLHGSKAIHKHQKEVDFSLKK